MSMGPMKKRMMLSFFIGFFIMLLIAVAGAFVFYNMYAEQKETIAKLREHTTRVYVAKENFGADGQVELTIDSFELKEINTNTLPNEYYTRIEQSTANSFEEANTNALDKHCLLWPSEGKKVYPKIDIPKGTIITMDMLWDNTEKITPDMREQEFNMIVLPSLLKEGDYVDIRLLLPTGNDFVVSSFKRVKKVTEGTVWFDLNEIDTQYISSAIIETCLTKGAMLYAVKYSEPTLQAETKVTYAVLPDVKEILLSDKNQSLFTTDLNELRNSYDEIRKVIENNMLNFQESDPENKKELILEKLEERIQKQQEERRTQIANGLFVDGSYDATQEGVIE